MTSKYFPSPADCAHHVVFGNIAIRTFAGAHIQLSLVEIPAHGVVDWHSHPNEQMGLMIKGQATFHVGDEVRTLGPGDFYFIPGDVPHRVIGSEEPSQALDVFYPIRPEYQ